MKTIEEAKQYVFDEENWTRGCRCSVCGHYVRKYRKTIYNVSAYALILIYKLTLKLNPDGGWLHITKEFAKHFGLHASAYDYSQLERWGLTERKKPNLEKNKPSNGFYRITQLGIDFVEGRAKVKKYLWMYNGKVLEWEDEETTLKEALGKKFDYQELMADCPAPKLPAQQTLIL